MTQAREPEFYLFERAESPDDLSERERVVLIMVCEGKTNKEIGKSLWLSHKTIEKYRASLCQKLRTPRTALQVRWAIRHRMIEP